MDRRTAIKAIGAVGATAVVGTTEEALAFNGEGCRTGRLKAGATTAKPLRGRPEHMAMLDDASYWPPGNYRTQIETGFVAKELKGLKGFKLLELKEMKGFKLLPGGGCNFPGHNWDRIPGVY